MPVYLESMLLQTMLLSGFGIEFTVLQMLKKKKKAESKVEKVTDYTITFHEISLYVLVVP